MEKEKIIEAIKQLDQYKKNFVQTYDLIVVLKNVDLNKIANQINGSLQLPHERKYNEKVCAIVGTEKIDEAKNVADFVITPSEIDKYADKKLAKSVARNYDIFIAQQNMMPKIAKLFGRVLGPRKKMPNPKVGSVFTPATDLKSLVEKLKKTINIQIRDQYHIQVPVGHEKLKPEEVAENIETVLKYILSHLPGGKSNIDKVYLKKTMSPVVELKL